MHDSSKRLLRLLENRKIIGAAHFPKDRLINDCRKHLNKYDQKRFDADFDELVKQEVILCEKKKTGKGSDWHISLNPKKMYLLPSLRE